MLFVVNRYDMLYKQDVSSEDMFLQMGSKNPSTASCEDLIVRTTSVTFCFQTISTFQHYIRFETQ